jgi:hypothetical protein
VRKQFSNTDDRFMIGTLLESNINSAIKACREEKSDVLDGKLNMELIKESLSNGYCDISGHISDLKMIGEFALPGSVCNY